MNNTFCTFLQLSKMTLTRLLATFFISMCSFGQVEYADTTRPYSINYTYSIYSMGRQNSAIIVRVKSTAGMASLLNSWLRCYRRVVSGNVRLCYVTEESVKYCSEDGNWFAKAGLEWTDYTPCVDKQVLRQTPSYAIIMAALCNRAGHYIFAL